MKRIKTINCIVTLALVKMGSCIKFCTFFQYPPHHKFPEPTDECLGLHVPLCTCNWYPDISNWRHLNNRCRYQSITQQYLKWCLIEDESIYLLSSFIKHLFNCCVIDWYLHLLFIYTQHGWLILAFELWLCDFLWRQDYNNFRYNNLLYYYIYNII